jgi:hypothetical protein
MEFLLQYFDNLDDLYGATGLVWERLRRTLLRLFSIAMISAVAAAGNRTRLGEAAQDLATFVLNRHDFGCCGRCYRACAIAPTDCSGNLNDALCDLAVPVRNRSIRKMDFCCLNR